MTLPKDSPTALAPAEGRTESTLGDLVGYFARQQVAALPLPGDVDVLAFDPGLQRLYAASEPGTVAVFAASSGRGVTELGRGFVGPNAHSVAADPATHRVYFPLADVAGRPVLRVMQPWTAGAAP